MAIEEVLLLTNGPGELSTWVPPVLQRLRHRLGGARIELFLIRDQFAAGSEAIKAKELRLEALSSQAGLLRRMASGKSGKRGAVLMLGGNPSQAVALGKAVGYPAFAYSFDPKSWRPGLRALLVDSERTQTQAINRGAERAKVQCVGNLVVDAMQDSPSQISRPAEVLLFPSSRPFAAKYLLGFMLAAAEHMAQQQPQLRFGWVRSRLLEPAVVQTALSGQLSRELGGVSAELEGDALLSQHGLRVEIIDEAERYAAMKQAQVALTVPGTNTLELALAGVPSAVLLPLHKPELIPLEGLAHWLLMLPGARPLKQRLVRSLAARIPHLALPNMWLGERVFPELRGVFSPNEAAQAALGLLNPAKQTDIKAKLQDLEAAPGAERLVEYVLSHC